MLMFIVGVIVGGCFGMIAMAILAAAGRVDEHFEFDEYSFTSIPQIDAKEKAEEVHDGSN